MTRAHFVQRARKKNSVAEKGEPYYWWKFRRGGKQLSKTRPRRSQLTQSAFWGRVYDLQDEYSGAPTLYCDVESQIESIKSTLEEIKDETQSSLDNMPQHLQESSVLNERIEAIDSAISELDGVDQSEDEEQDEETRCESIWEDVTSALDLSCS